MSFSLQEDVSGVSWEMSAWSESFQRGHEGRPSFWSHYTFATEAEALKERARLEKKWKNEDGSGPYTFDIYRVERTRLLPNKKSTKKGKKR